MKKNFQAVHDLLIKHPDGLSVPEMEAVIGIPNTSINSVCRRNPMIYVDRWKVHMHADGSASCWVPVYCLAVAPENAPRPSIRPGAYLKAMRAMEVAEAR